MMILFMAELQSGQYFAARSGVTIGETAPAIPNRDLLLMQLNLKRCSQFFEERKWGENQI